LPLEFKSNKDRHPKRNEKDEFEEYFGLNDPEPVEDDPKKEASDKESEDNKEDEEL
jgi:hypothetical protein